MMFFPKGSWNTLLFSPVVNWEGWIGEPVQRLRVPYGPNRDKPAPAAFELEHDVWELRVCYIQGPKQFVAYAARHGHDAFYDVMEALCVAS